MVFGDCWLFGPVPFLFAAHLLLLQFTSTYLCAPHDHLGPGQQMIVTDLTFIEETVSYPWDWSVFKTQMEEQPQISQIFRNRRHLTRRPNACVPCRKSKLRVCPLPATYVPRMSNKKVSAMASSHGVQHAQRNDTNPM